MQSVLEAVKTVKTPKVPPSGDEPRDELPDPDCIPFGRWLEELGAVLEAIDSEEWQFVGTELLRTARLVRFTGATSVHQFLDRREVLEAGDRAEEASIRRALADLDYVATGGLDRNRAEVLAAASSRIRRTCLV